VLAAQDVAEGLRFLRTLRTTEVAAVAGLLLPAALAGEAGVHTLEVLQMVGIVLTEREAA
jgi:hypothetical protein